MAGAPGTPNTMPSIGAAGRSCITRRACKAISAWHEPDRRVYAIGVHAMRHSIRGPRAPSLIPRGGWVALALLILSFAVPAQARRLALVIGNDSYQNVQPLKNARADSKAIAAELKEVGFAVTLKQDLT